MAFVLYGFRSHFQKNLEMENKLNSKDPQNLWIHRNVDVIALGERDSNEGKFEINGDICI